MDISDSIINFLEIRNIDCWVNFIIKANSIDFINLDKNLKIELMEITKKVVMINIKVD